MACTEFWTFSRAIREYGEMRSSYRDRQNDCRSCRIRRNGRLPDRSMLDRRSLRLGTAAYLAGMARGSEDIVGKRR